VASLFQYLEDTPARASVEFRVQNVLTDLDGAAGGTCTVTLTRPDGTPGPASGAVAHVSTGVYELSIDGPADPYYYDVEWAGTIGTKTVKAHTRVEWVGDFLFTVADLRGYQPIGGGGTPFDDPVKYPDAKIHQVRAEVLGEFCRRLNFSPVRRYTHEVHSVDRGGPVILKQLYPGDLLDISVAGVAQSVGDYAIGRGGVLLPVSTYAVGSWTSYGQGVVAVGYSHGWDSFEDDRGREAALMRAAMKLNPSVSSTMNSYSPPDGGQYNWDRAGTRNAAGEKVYFGVGAIAEWINEHRQASVAVA
jgi:hypothetical protein